ncbi:unnamed protein product [Vitrella brassicaformis CCMP3155]|uniref:Uncharacterized protein n=1 Tax=Vitrella brassicaformis (strain CCMP3155) TaxID=1169540 RepID=A0A0G4EDQ1_VITBC|nr:unnamed protein product [Vitrella brassicaformis CCMP3155]|eukprot:CEL93500.1 unnamed protein product [Vitrella brassicaformis CCMP3155]
MGDSVQTRFYQLLHDLGFLETAGRLECQTADCCTATFPIYNDALILAMQSMEARDTWCPGLCCSLVSAIISLMDVFRGTSMSSVNGNRLSKVCQRLRPHLPGPMSLLLSIRINHHIDISTKGTAIGFHRLTCLPWTTLTSCHRIGQRRHVSRSWQRLRSKWARRRWTRTANR